MVAIRVFGQFANINVVVVLVIHECWNSYMLVVCDIVFLVLMLNINSFHVLFIVIEKGDVVVYIVNVDRRNQLMKHKDLVIQECVIVLFKELTPGDRMKVYEESKSILTFKPDSTNGHAVF